MTKLLHLYPDLLNLYGENSNIKALCNLFDQARVVYQLDLLSINDEVNIADYDFIYIGSGTEENQKLALSHLLKYKEDLKEYINKFNVMLVTGNSIELFGNYIEDLDKKYDALGIFDFYSKQVNYRIAKEVYAKSNISHKDIIGFINQNSISYEIKENPLFILNNQNEGIIHKNFYGTNVIGPLLVRNPQILIYIAEKILKTRMTGPNLVLENEAYDNFILKYNSK